MFSDTPMGAWHTYTATELANVPNLPLTTPMTVQYSNSAENFASQEEVVVFDRDPDEAFTTFAGLVGDLPDTWNANVITPVNAPVYETLPDAVDLPYPLVPNVPPPSLLTLQTPMFVGPSGGFGPPGHSPAGDPGGAGSIKSVYLYKRGICSREQDIQSILGTVDLGLVGAISKLPGILSLLTENTNYVHSVAWATEAPPFPEESPIGGFITAASAYIPGPFNSVVYSAHVNVTYQFGIAGAFPFNGILNVAASENENVEHNPFSNGVASGMENDLPPKIQAQAFQLQSAPIPAGAAGTVDCTDHGVPRDPSCFLLCDTSNGIPSGDDISRDPTIPFQTQYCPRANQTLGFAIESGAGHLNIPAPFVPAIEGTLSQQQQVNGNAVWSNVRCNFKPSYVVGNAPTCEVMARAARLNPFPDVVELVWFDRFDQGDLTDFSSNAAVAPLVGVEGFALFVALNQTITSPMPDLTPLCQRTPAGTFFTRRYAHDEIDYPIGP